MFTFVLDVCRADEVFCNKTIQLTTVVSEAENVGKYENVCATVCVGSRLSCTLL